MSGINSGVQRHPHQIRHQRTDNSQLEFIACPVREWNLYERIIKPLHEERRNIITELIDKVQISRFGANVQQQLRLNKCCYVRTLIVIFDPMYCEGTAHSLYDKIPVILFILDASAFGYIASLKVHRIIHKCVKGEYFPPQ